ncbi:Rid family hydrolase [Sulfitobacter sabulilitoris]|nr:Rid family hydrolase [Sulfitobacter sabulilitoris]
MTSYPSELISNGNPMDAVVGGSRAVRAGARTGIGGTAPAGPDCGTGDVAAQPRQCLESIKSALEQAGSGLQDGARPQVIRTDIDDWKATIDGRNDYSRDVRRVATILAVSRFENPGRLVEYQADAIISDWQG